MKNAVIDHLTEENNPIVCLSNYSVCVFTLNELFSIRALVTYNQMPPVTVPVLRV